MAETGSPADRALARLAGDWLWRTDAEGRLVEVDDRFQAATGLAPEAVIGRTRTELADVRRDARAWADHLEALAAGRAFGPFRWALVAGPETRFLVERGEPLHDPSGAFAGHWIAVQDETETLNARRALEREHNLLIEALDAMSDGFALFDAEDRLVLTNGPFVRRFPHLSTRLAPGTPFAEFAAARAAAGDALATPEAIAARDTMLAGGATLVDEQVVGATVLRATEFRSRAGGRVLLVADVTDLRRSTEELGRRIAELQASEARLAEQSAELSRLNETLRDARDAAEAASRAKSEFLAIVSHELRTPLNVVIGFSQLIADDAHGDPGDPRYAEYAREIQSGGQGLLAIINDIIDLSNADSGRLALVCEPVAPAELLEPVAGAYAMAAVEAKVHIDVEAAADLPRVDVDGRRLRRALGHLVANAIRFSHAGGTVTLSAQRTAEGLALAVRDEGIGIAAEDIPRALERFGKVDATLARHHGGSGVGLPLAQALIELHGGRLDLESAPGAGTRAVLVVPPARILPG